MGNLFHYMLLGNAWKLLEIAVVSIQVLNKLFIHSKNAANGRPRQHLLLTFVNPLLLLLDAKLRKQPL
jgi:hypothetical protein